MKYKKVIDEIIKEYNYASELDRRRAYIKCIEYADENYDFTDDYNSFLEEAADALGQKRMYKETVKASVRLNGKEKIQLMFNENNGHELIANADGLAFLSRVLRNLAKSRLPGEHAHLHYSEPPLYGDSFPLTIYYEDDVWFDKYAVKLEEAGLFEDFEETVETRDISGEDIRAFISVEITPPSLMMTRGKIYHAISVEKYEGQDIWKKEIRADLSRLYIFKFVRDDGDIQQLALDIDDEDFFFYTENDLKGL